MKRSKVTTLKTTLKKELTERLGAAPLLKWGQVFYGDWIKKIVPTICLLLLGTTCWGQIATMRNKIESLIADRNLKIGVALLDITTGDTLTMNGNDRFPMQSVFKLHISLAILHEIDQRRLSLTDSIRFDKSELYSHLWSPLQKANPNGVTLPLCDVMRSTIQWSDNSGCDKLLSLAGGAKKVNHYIHSIGIDQINIENNEFELQSSWGRQFNNWTTPWAAIQLLKKIDNGSLLKKNSQQFLWETMQKTSTGSIRNKLPKRAKVGYKTGFSGQNAQGETAANNNIGIMILPNNRKIAYAIFITNSKENQDINYSIIAEIGSYIYHLYDPQ